jgi:23S rRNA-intervening sequence protein
MIMTYKDLNVFQRAYKAAIDLHLFLNAKNPPISPEMDEGLRRHSREILSDIANGFNQKTAKSKRFLNFRALDAIRSMLMDLEFLSDIRCIPEDEFKHLYGEYEVCAKQLFKLNQSILNKSADKPQEKEAKAQA